MKGNSFHRTLPHKCSIWYSEGKWSWKWWLSPSWARNLFKARFHKKQGNFHSMGSSIYFCTHVCMQEHTEQGWSLFHCFQPKLFCRLLSLSVGPSIPTKPVIFHCHLSLLQAGWIWKWKWWFFPTLAIIPCLTWSVQLHVKSNGDVPTHRPQIWAVH